MDLYPMPDDPQFCADCGEEIPACLCETEASPQPEPPPMPLAAPQYDDREGPYPACRSQYKNACIKAGYCKAPHCCMD